MSNIFWALTIGAVLCIAGFTLARRAHKRKLERMAAAHLRRAAGAQVDSECNVHVLPARQAGKTSSEWLRSRMDQVGASPQAGYQPVGGADLGTPSWGGGPAFDTPIPAAYSGGGGTFDGGGSSGDWSSSDSGSSSSSDSSSSSSDSGSSSSSSD